MHTSTFSACQNIQEDLTHQERLVMGVVGAAIKGFGSALKTAKRNKASKQVFDHVKGKPFPKSTQKQMYQPAIRRKAMIQAGYERQPAMQKGGKADQENGAIKLKEM